MAARPYDIIVYGASGFTGQYAALEMVRTSPGKKLAIAGRNRSKLEQTLSFIEQEIGSDFIKSDVGMIIADNNDDYSIKEMCRQCRVVANCVGPYRFYGEQVVRSCVEAGTHYVDVTGEPEFMLKCQLNYHNAAVDKGIHIVSSCGFDSIPADVGLELLREKFHGQLTKAESYVHLNSAVGGGGNYGTYLTIVHSVAHFNEFKKQQREVAKNSKLEYVGEKLAFRNGGFSETERKWFLPFKGADPFVVRRTQLHESSTFGKTPLQYGAYFTFSSFLQMIGCLFFIFNVLLLTRFTFGIKLLERFPSFFSFGVFSRRSYLTKKEIEGDNFSVVFHGEGYSSETSGIPDRKMSLKLTGPNAGYIFTTYALIAAAQTLLDDPLRNKGGVLTPGSAFQSTGYSDRLMKRGVKIDIL